MHLNINSFKVSSYGTEEFTIGKIRELQKKIDLSFSPDFLYLNISIGCVMSKGSELYIGDFRFTRTVTFKDYDLYFENFKLFGEYNSQFMVFAYSESNQVFFLMGTTPENMNQIFLVDNNFGNPPKKVSDSVFSFFNYDLKEL